MKIDEDISDIIELIFSDSYSYQVLKMKRK